MNSKTTGIWFVIAAALFAFIYFWEHHAHGPAAPANMLPELRPAAVMSIEIFPAGALEICAVRTNGNWQLTRPVTYPAQTTAIEMLLSTLQKLAPATRISAAELREHQATETEFGFDNPQFSIIIAAGGHNWQLKVGNKTAPGDQVFLRVAGTDGAFVTGSDWLGLIPRSANDWRDTALVDSGNVCDHIMLTNGTKAIELERDATNHLWRMLRPLQARADSDHITEALQKLYAAQVSQFVMDDTNADLAAFGLQPADLDLWLDHGSNFVAALHVGKPLTNDATQVFVRREGWNTIAASAREPLSFWRGAMNDFRDPHLLELTAPVTGIEVRGQTNFAGFTLQRRGSNDWAVAGEKFPADAENVQMFLKLLADLRVAEFVKDVVTPPDLQAYGLAAPARQIILRSAAGYTNAVLAQLLFGAMQTNEIFVRRADEDFIYSLSLADFSRLPEAGWEFRDRRIWNFDGTNVAAITLRQNGRTRQLVRTGLNQWSLAPGSQGIINPPALEETAYRLGKLTAAGWVGRNITEPEKYGFNTNNLQISVELKNGEKHSVDFGMELPRAQTALAGVTLDGERWAFVFPPALYQFVLSYLTIPANVL